VGPIVGDAVAGSGLVTGNWDFGAKKFGTPDDGGCCCEVVVGA